MAKIAIVTDTNSGILPQEAESLGVYTIPMPFFIDGKLYLEGKDIDAETFFRFQAADAEIKTSMPSVGDVADVWNRLLKTYDRLIYIPMSSGLSNSCSVTALMAQDEFPGRVFVIDNQRISVTQRQSVLEAKAMADAGMEAEEICQKLLETKLDASIYIAVDTLKYLRRGGRVTAAAAAMGTVLNIKPVLKIKGEKLDAFAKVRGKAAARESMLRALKKEIATDPRLSKAEQEGRLGLGVAYTGDRAEGESMAAVLQAAFPDHLFRMDPLALSIACHTGSGAVGIGCYVNLVPDFI